MCMLKKILIIILIVVFVVLIVNDYNENYESSKNCETDTDCNFGIKCINKKCQLKKIGDGCTWANECESGNCGSTYKCEI